MTCGMADQLKFNTAKFNAKSDTRYHWSMLIILVEMVEETHIGP
jgi:hypothetical protein